MKKLLLLSLLLCTFTWIKASHIIGGEIKISHITGFQYKIEMNLYRDASGIASPPSAQVNAYERQSLNQIGVFPLALDSFHILNPVTIGCGTPLLTIEKYYYSLIVTLDPNNYDHPGGYLFRWSSCCRNSGVANLINSSSQGSSLVTMFPPVVDASGSQIINSTPQLNSPGSDFAINNHPYYLNFGGTDPDGDSLVYTLFTPFDSQVPNGGTVTPVSSPFLDPSTQFNPIQWANCYNEDNQINGTSNSSCTSLNEPDRLQVDPLTGMLTMIPGENAPAYFVFGIWCQEYRNGQLIGSVFRDFQISVVNYQIDPNGAPQVHVPQLQALATWDADTMVFSGSPVCVQLGVTDPDSIADVQIEAVYSDYDPGDLVFVQDYAVIMNPDTFMTALCFQPDSFLSYTTRGDVVALNPGCFDLRGDTLPFYFKFVNYSRAGWGGTKTVPMTSLTGSIDLFTLLDYDPLPGGTWYDLDGNNHMNPNGFLEWKYITTPKTYRFIYVQQEPNYPPDTSELTLNFVFPTSLENLNTEEISVYPNPNNGQFVIDIPSEMIGSSARIYSYDLKLIDNVELNSVKNSLSIQKEGLYFIRINGEVKKIIVR